jgi:hypothetical protein
MEKKILALSAHMPIPELAQYLGESEHRLIKLMRHSGMEPKKVPRLERVFSPRKTLEAENFFERK